MTTTPNLGLTQYAGTDTINFLTQYNADMTKVDDYAGATNTQLAQKASKEELIVQERRIDVFDSLPEGATTNDARLEDICVGADGKVWDNPANAVRGQVLSLKKDLGNLEDLNTPINQIDDEWEIGNINGANGEPSYSNNQLRTKNFIKVKPNTKYFFKIADLSSAGNILCYDSNRNYLTGRTKYGVSKRVIEIDNDTYYVKITSGTAYGTIFNNDISLNYPHTIEDYYPHTVTNDRKDINYEKVKTDNIYLRNMPINQIDDEWELGNIDGATGLKGNATLQIRTRNFIKVKPGESYFFKVGNFIGIGNIICYDKDKNFLGSSHNIYGKSGYIVTFDSETHYVKITSSTTYGNVFNGDICLNYPVNIRDYYPHTFSLTDKKVKDLQAEKDDLNRISYGALPESIPQNYVLKDESVFENFSNVNEFTVVSGSSGTVSASDTRLTGANSLKLEVTQSGGFISVDKVINTDLSEMKTVTIWVFIDSVSLNGQADIVNGVSIYFTSTSGYSKCFVGGVGMARLHKGWNCLTISKDEFSNTGNESWDNRFIKMRIRLDVNSGKTGSVLIDRISMNTESIPRCIFTFDDGFDDVYNYAYPIMKSYGMRGVVYVCKNVVGLNTYMDRNKLDQLYEYGWDIANHTVNHANLANLTLKTQIENEILENIEYLESCGYLRSAYHFAYPEGGYNKDVLDVVHSLGIKTARTTVQACNYPPFDGTDLLRNVQIFTDTTFEYLKAEIDKAYIHGYTIILMIHRLQENPIISSAYSVANFRRLVDYVYSTGIPVVTISDWYNGLKNPHFGLYR